MLFAGFLFRGTRETISIVFSSKICLSVLRNALSGGFLCSLVARMMSRRTHSRKWIRRAPRATASAQPLKEIRQIKQIFLRATSADLRRLRGNSAKVHLFYLLIHHLTFKLFFIILFRDTWPLHALSVSLLKELVLVAGFRIERLFNWSKFPNRIPQGGWSGLAEGALGCFEIWSKNAFV